MVFSIVLLSGLNHHAVNRYVKVNPEHLVQFCEAHSPFNGNVMKSTLWRGEFWLNDHEMEPVGEGGNERVVEPFVQEKGTPREEHCRVHIFHIPWPDQGNLN